MYRIGIGWDLHRLEAGRPFILGGARIPHDRGAVAHSDGDTLVHAVIDALLGGAGLGNIGLLYPDTDPAYRGADSMTLLRDTVGRLRGAGWVPVNVDTVVVAQRPALNPHLDTIRRNIADALGISIESVSVKPKTAEKVGPEGREEAVSAQAIILLQKRGG
ncbi:MAG TPA: 2-C-methyl-D-erythritol 2,4-cyclodiphosphate synthase [Candidatus Hydrogenedentes bacterium]|nr:2-C-methyl-D-erythritol 2,4-cyclodiphosphate synthase [Candidatus Hydrogenedentota bacterium]